TRCVARHDACSRTLRASAPLVPCRTSLRASVSLYCAGPPRYLHSFPTRRSSDLVSNSTSKVLPSLSSTTAKTAPVISTTDWHTRSEEHTSELQSRFDLVCRLLLEKKNMGIG